MRHSLCPTCGHPIAVKSSVDKLGALLQGRQRQLFEIVESAGTAGITSMAIFERMYADRSDGGPESGPRIIPIMRRQLNPKLRPIGLQIVCRGRMYGRYFLETIKTEERT